MWTTWGVPCRYENLAWEKLEKEFEDENIVFVAVSCDNDRAVWEKRVRENPKGEVQLYMGSDRSFMDFYMIRDPSFYFDRSGWTYYQFGYVTTF